MTETFPLISTNYYDYIHNFSQSQDWCEIRMQDKKSTVRYSLLCENYLANGRGVSCSTNCAL